MDILPRATGVCGVLACLVLLAGCGEPPCPTDEQVDLDYVVEHWDAISPVYDRDGLRCAQFFVADTSTPICEYLDEGALAAAVEAGARHPVGSTLLLHGGGAAVDSAADRIALLRARCGVG